MFFCFLVSLGLMQVDLTFIKNIFFTLASMVSITLVKMVLLEVATALFMWSPLNLYVWTGSVLHFIVAVMMLTTIIFIRKPVERFASYVVQSRLYYLSFAVLLLGLVVILVLTMPSSFVLATLYEQYGQVGYQVA